MRRAGTDPQSGHAAAGGQSVTAHTSTMPPGPACTSVTSRPARRRALTLDPGTPHLRLPDDLDVLVRPKIVKSTGSHYPRDAPHHREPAIPATNTHGNTRGSLKAIWR